MPPVVISESSVCHAEGSLKDASEIVWYNDAKDDNSIVPPPAPVNNSTLNSFVYCAGHAVKPTEKICKTLVASSTSAKQLAPELPQGVPTPKHVFVGTSGQEDNNNNNNNEDAPTLEDVMDDEEEDAENAEKEEAYQWTKKLGD
jgi:hypothetical protein